MQSIRVPECDVPVLAQADVVVCGGGCAGVTAAVAAARHGAGVVLLERWPSVGGMATNALVNIWHCSDREKTVIHGLVRESLERADRHGWVQPFPSSEGRHETHRFDSEGMRIIWQRMLDEAGVRTLCHLVAGDTIVADGALQGVFVQTKQGRRAVLGKVVIDATGDGDVAAQAGVPFDFGREGDGRVQGMTLVFALRGLDRQAAAGAGAHGVNAVLEEMRARRDRGEFPAFNEGNARAFLRHASDHTYWNMLPVAGDPLDEEKLSRLTARAREMLVEYLDLWREHMPGYGRAGIEQTGFSLGIRESRRIRGRKTLDQEMVLGAVKHTDAIGHGVWMIDIHDPLGSGYTTYTDRSDATMLAAGTSYHIPFGMCVNDQFPNLGVVGRCASSTHEAHASVRVQSHCMVMGQGVGTAAALALGAGAELNAVDVRRLQATLRRDDVYLGDR